jgi:hypothetical protein
MLTAAGDWPRPGRPAHIRSIEGMGIEVARHKLEARRLIEYVPQQLSGIPLQPKKWLGFLALDGVAPGEPLEQWPVIP